jgi:hypothetical protein
MKMDKKTQILLGVAAVAVIGYFIYKNNKPAKANAVGKGSSLNPTVLSDLGLGVVSSGQNNGCPCAALAPQKEQDIAPNGWDVCAGKNEKGEYDKMCKRK